MGGWGQSFFKEIESFSADIGATFLCARNVALEKYHSFWNSLESVDLMFCVSWRYLIPPEVYERARLGAFVFHDSMLPKYRGFAPTVWAIINGESYTGATLMSISEGIDEGDIGKRLDILGGRERWIIDGLNADKTIINEILVELSNNQASVIMCLEKMEKYKFSRELQDEVENNWKNLRKDLEAEGVEFE